MDNRKDLKETYNRIAEHWHKDHSADKWFVSGIDKFISFLPLKALVLDAGCGAGDKSKYLIEKGMEVIGTDFSEKMIEISKREVPKGNFFVSDVYDASSLKYKFDGILLQAVLLHIPKKDAQKVINGFVSILKHSGYICVAVKEKRPDGVDEEMKTEGDYEFSYQRFFSYFTIEEIKNILSESGCEIVYENIVPVAQTRWVQVIGKKTI